MFQGTHWAFFTSHFTSSGDGRGRFLGVPLHACDLNVFKHQAEDFAKKTKEGVTSYFLDTHPVSKATTFLNFGAWPWDNIEQLALHGNSDISLIAHHFAPVLCPLPQHLSQFIGLKSRMHAAFESGSLPSLPQDPVLSDVLKQFHNTWEIVQMWDKKKFGDVFPVIEASLCTLDDRGD